MTKCSDIISSAFRRSGIASAAEPISAIEAAVGLERLKGMYERMSQGLLGQVYDYYLSTGAYTAQEGQRIFKADGASVVTLPVTIVDDGTGLTRMPYDGSFVIVVDPNTNSPLRYIYNSALGKWQEISQVGAADEAPLSNQFEEALKDMLGVLLNDENGQEPTATLKSNAALGKLAIASRYQSTRRDAKQVMF